MSPTVLNIFITQTIYEQKIVKVATENLTFSGWNLARGDTKHFVIGLINDCKLGRLGGNHLGQKLR